MRLFGPYFGNASKSWQYILSSNLTNLTDMRDNGAMAVASVQERIARNRQRGRDAAKNTFITVARGRDSVKRSKSLRQDFSPPDHARASPCAHGAPALAFESLPLARNDESKKRLAGAFFESLRRGRDSNPRSPLEAQHISSVLHSTTLAPLHMRYAHFTKDAVWSNEFVRLAPVRRPCGLLTLARPFGTGKNAQSHFSHSGTSP